MNQEQLKEKRDNIKSVVEWNMQRASLTDSRNVDGEHNWSALANTVIIALASEGVMIADKYAELPKTPEKCYSSDFYVGHVYKEGQYSLIGKGYEKCYSLLEEE